MDSSLLRAVLEQGTCQLFDETLSLETNAHKKQALKWFRQSHQKEFSGSVNPEFPGP